MSSNNDIAKDLAAKLNTKEKTWKEPGKQIKPARETASVRMTKDHQKAVKLMAVEFDCGLADIHEAAIGLLQAVSNKGKTTELNAAIATLRASRKDQSVYLAELLETAIKKLK